MNIYAEDWPRHQSIIPSRLPRKLVVYGANLPTNIEILHTVAIFVIIILEAYQALKLHLLLYYGYRNNNSSDVKHFFYTEHRKVANINEVIWYCRSSTVVFSIRGGGLNGTLVAQRVVLCVADIYALLSKPTLPESVSVESYILHRDTGRFWYGHFQPIFTRSISSRIYIYIYIYIYQMYDHRRVWL